MQIKIVLPIPSQSKYLVFSPPCHIALARASSTMLNRSGKDRHLVLLLILRAKSSKIFSSSKYFFILFVLHFHNMFIASYMSSAKYLISLTLR